MVSEIKGYDVNDFFAFDIPIVLYPASGVALQEERNENEGRL